MELSQNPSSEAHCVVDAPSLQVLFSLLEFNLSNILLGGFSQNVASMVVEQLRLTESISDELLARRQKKADSYILKSILDFCPNSSFSQSTITGMQNLSSALLAAFPSLFASLVSYLDEVNEFFEFIFYFRKEERTIEISEFENSLRAYKTVDSFLDDLISLVFVLWGVAKEG